MYLYVNLCEKGWKCWLPYMQEEYLEISTVFSMYVHVAFIPISMNIQKCLKSVTTYLHKFKDLFAAPSVFQVEAIRVGELEYMSSCKQLMDCINYELSFFFRSCNKREKCHILSFNSISCFEWNYWTNKLLSWIWVCHVNKAFSTTLHVYRK